MPLCRHAVMNFVPLRPRGVAPGGTWRRPAGHGSRSVTSGPVSLRILFTFGRWIRVRPDPWETSPGRVVGSGPFPTDPAGYRRRARRRTHRPERSDSSPVLGQIGQPFPDDEPRVVRVPHVPLTVPGRRPGDHDQPSPARGAAGRGRITLACSGSLFTCLSVSARASSPRRGDPGRSLSPGSAVGDGQDDVSGLLLRFDVPRRLDHALQRVVPIDDRPVLPGFDEIFEEADVLLGLSRW